MASQFARRTDGSDLMGGPIGRRNFYVPAELDSLPPHAWDMLITRIDQLVMWRLPLHKFLSLVGCSSHTPLSLGSSPAETRQGKTVPLVVPTFHRL